MKTTSRKHKKRQEKRDKRKETTKRQESKKRVKRETTHTERKRGGGSGAAEELVDDTTKGGDLLAELLQIALEVGVLALKLDDPDLVGGLNNPLLLARLGGGHVVVGPPVEVLLVGGLVGEDLDTLARRDGDLLAALALDDDLWLGPASALLLLRGGGHGDRGAWGLLNSRGCVVLKGQLVGVVLLKGHHGVLGENGGGGGNGGLDSNSNSRGHFKQGGEALFVKEGVSKFKVKVERQCCDLTSEGLWWLVGKKRERTRR